MNNKIIKLCNWKMTKEDEVFYYNNTDAKLIYDKDKSILIKGGRIPFVNLIKTEEFIKTLNYFEKFYDKENVLTEFYTKMIFTIDKNICKDDLISVINDFVTINNDLIETMNEDNIETDDEDAKKFMKLSLIYKLIIPIVNYYLYKQIKEDNNDRQIKISYKIFISILKLIDEKIYKKLYDTFTNLANNDTRFMRYVDDSIMKCIIYNIPKYRYSNDYRFLNYSFFKYYLYNISKCNV